MHSLSASSNSNSATSSTTSSRSSGSSNRSRRSGSSSGRKRCMLIVSVQTSHLSWHSMAPATFEYPTVEGGRMRHTKPHQESSHYPLCLSNYLPSMVCALGAVLKQCDPRGASVANRSRPISDGRGRLVLPLVDDVILVWTLVVVVLFSSADLSFQSSSGKTTLILSLASNSNSCT